MSRSVKKLRKTLHLTVEGEAEQLLANRIRAKLTAGKMGPSTRVLNARGKGALNVVQTSLRCTTKGDYDVRAVILDTDTDWTDRAKKLARQGRLVVIEMSPCLEAVLLCAKGLHVPDSTAACKDAFARHFGGPAHDPRVIDRHFTVEFLQESATCEVGTRLFDLFK